MSIDDAGAFDPEGECPYCGSVVLYSEWEPAGDDGIVCPECHVASSPDDIYPLAGD